MNVPTNKAIRSVRVMSSAQGEGKFIRQAGPPGHVGHVIMLVEPATGDGLTFEWAVPESAIPERFSQAVLRGIHLTCSEDGPFRDCAFTQTRVRIIDGSYHEIDSRERSYEMASAFAFEDAVQRAGGVTNAAS
jgi:elongation factor G